MRLTLGLLATFILGSWLRGWWACNRIELQKARAGQWSWRSIVWAFLRQYVGGHALPWWGPTTGPNVY
jgi:hypothetical protein